MVRLRAHTKQIEYIDELSFNSKMVRLRVKLDLYFSSAYFWFQFQDGAIKRAFGRRDMDMPCGFNSKMVRLRAIFTKILHVPH